MKDILFLIKDYNAVLSTGHISPKESFIVIEAAKDIGLNKIIITHPEFHIVGMSIEDQKKMVNDYDIMLEKVYAQPIGNGLYKKNLQDNIQVIKEIGSKNIIISTDGGQIQNPEWYNTIKGYIDCLYEAGFSQMEIDQMTKTNPAKMLGI